MRAEENILDCHCPPDCEGTSFDTTVTTKELKAWEICSDPHTEEQKEFALDNWYRNKYDVTTWRFKEFLEDPETLVDREEDGLELDEKEQVNICSQVMANNMAKMTIVIQNPSALKVMKSVRVSFTDQLGMIGTV